MTSSPGEFVEEMVIGVDIDDELHSDAGSSPTLGTMERSSNPLSHSDSPPAQIRDITTDTNDYTRRRTDRNEERGEIREPKDHSDVSGRFEISDGEGDDE